MVPKSPPAGERAVGIVVVASTVLVLGPALRPGYVLLRDQVFTPDQTLLPWMLGLGAGLPRSVPQDAVVAVLSGPVPGWVLEKAALLGALLALGAGAARLLRPVPAPARAAGAVLAVWSAYVAERLLMGHWSLLVAVGVLPWALLAARDLRSGRSRAGPRWLLLVGLASLTPSGGLLVLLLSAPVALGPRSRVRRPRRYGYGAAALALQVPWVLPALLHPSTAGAPDLGIFGLRSEGPWGLLVTALGTGGVWNAEAAPASRGTALALVLTGVVAVLGALGLPRLSATVGRAVTWSLVVGAAAGALLAVCGGWSVTAGAVSWLIDTVPGGGLLRDGQKWLAPLVLLWALAAPLGAVRLARRWRDPGARAALLVGLAVLPIACLPDLVWGATGRLWSATYPPDWDRVRAHLSSSPEPGDVISLPWSTFRRFAWNGDRTVLDPAPRALPRTTLTSDRLLVLVDGTVLAVPGEDPRADAIDAAVREGRPLAPVLAGLGVGWALVATAGGPAGPVGVPPGARVVVQGSDLTLYRLADAPAPTGPVSGSLPVAVADLAVLTLLAGCAAGAVTPAPRPPRRSPTGR